MWLGKLGMYNRYVDKLGKNTFCCSCFRVFSLSFLPSLLLSSFSPFNAASLSVLPFASSSASF